MDNAAGGERTMKLAVVEVLDRDGHVRHVVPIPHWPMTIGRAIDCDVVLDDMHVAAHHATVSESEDGLSLTVGDSVNGVEWPGTRLPAGGSAALPSGEVFQLGATRLRVRRRTDALAPERALTPEPAASRLPLPALIAALLTWTLCGQWLNSDPGGRLTDYLPPILAELLALVVWCGLWALVSKLFRHRFEFWPHTRIAVSYLLIIEALELALPILAFMIGWTFLSRIAGLATVAVACAMVVAHLTRIVPSRRRLMAGTMGALYAAGVAVMLTINYQMQDRFFGELYVATLAPPAFRLVSPVEPARFIEEARGLKTILDAHVKDDDPGGALWDPESMAHSAASLPPHGVDRHAAR